MPRELVLDNAKNFDNDMVKEFCHSMGIKMDFISVYHPVKWSYRKCKGQIFRSIKKILLDQKKGKWIEELLGVVWWHYTTKSRATKLTPLDCYTGKKLSLQKKLKMVA